MEVCSGGLLGPGYTTGQNPSTSEQTTADRLNPTLLQSVIGTLHISPLFPIDRG